MKSRCANTLCCTPEVEEEEVGEEEPVVEEGKGEESLLLFINERP